MSESANDPQPDQSIVEAGQAISENRGWFIALGIVLIILGILCIGSPLVTTIAVKVFLGWCFLIGGVFQIIHSFSAQNWKGFLWNLLIGLLYGIVGAWLAFFPLTGIIGLTVLISIMFIAEGLMKFIMGIGLRPDDGWIWTIISGIAAIVLGFLLFSGLPGTAAWAIGLLVGINLLFSGWAFLALAMVAKKTA